MTAENEGKARGYGTDVGEGVESLAEAERQADGTIKFTVVQIESDDEEKS